ncbi:MAG: Diacylglycerol kinase [candidate division WWE3 bacterium GW2011_GWB1_41_6]|nr:MAG: Diacylglycerol kinase [candidate division WWE3 bacterium GW2011_GWB1_41_6]
MTNTVVEELIDQLIKEYHEGVRIIKDLSAGFVLTTSITTLAILILIFGDRIFSVL